jgi:hypothetical protein
LAAHRSGEAAEGAAQAGAVALLQRRDAEAAARSSLPVWAREAAVIRVDGRRVTVRVRARLPLDALGSRLATTGRADAGPEPRP